MAHIVHPGRLHSNRIALSVLFFNPRICSPSVGSIIPLHFRSLYRAFRPFSMSAAAHVQDHEARRSTAQKDAVETAAEPLPARVEELASNIHAIQTRITAAHQTSPTKMTVTPSLIAVSKTKPASDILALYRIGFRDFGENYVQECIEKAAQLPSDIRWHFIGNLQSNKVKTLVQYVPNLHYLHTADSLKKLNMLNAARGGEEGRPALNILLQINTSGESTKSGLPPSGPEILTLIKHIQSSCPHLTFRGLMTIGDPDNSRGTTTADANPTNPDFATLLQLRQHIGAELGINETEIELSMGMSCDFEEAVQAGSKWVRVGSSVFGARVYPAQTQ